jgi:hypothetical protein
MKMAGAIYVAVRFGRVSMFCKWTMTNSHSNALAWEGDYRHGYYVLAHYGRYVRDGAVRVDASSNDDQVLVLAFDDTNRGWFTVILLNIATSSKSVSISGAGLPTSYEAFRTSASEKGVEIGAQDPGSITLPPNSVTTLYAGVSTKVQPLRIHAAGTPAASVPTAAYDLRGRLIYLFASPAGKSLTPGVYTTRVSEGSTPRLHLPNAQH